MTRGRGPDAARGARASQPAAAAAASSSRTAASTAGQRAAPAARDTRDARLLLLLAGAILVAWSFVVPIFEAPDEFLHWQYARYLHDERKLPIYSAGFAEGNSPPLYYALVAPVATRTPTPPNTIWMDGLDKLQIPFTPRVQLSAPDDFERYWPIRWARLLTVLMSLVTVGLCARAGYDATGRASTALLTGGLVAFLPQFAFRGSQVSNDALLTTMAAWTVYLLVRIIRHGFTWRRGVGVAAAYAAAYLCKISAICLGPPIALVILSEPVLWRDRIKHLSVFLVTLGFVLPWSIRNVMLYGDVFASAAMHEAVPGLLYKRSIWDLHHVTTLPRETFKSFVGFFGYLTLKLPKGVYALYLVFMLTGLAGMARRCWRERANADRTLLRLGLMIAAVLASNWAVHQHINLSFDQPQGRYMFPSLAAVMLAIAIGLEEWRPWKPAIGGASVSDSPGTNADRISASTSLSGSGSLWPARATVGGWLLANVAILLFIVRPAYYPALVPEISEAMTMVRPSPARDIAAIPREAGLYTITGSQPELAGEVRTAAPDARFVMFDLQGQAPVGVANGEVVLTLGSDATPAAATTEAAAGTAREVRLPFTWKTDGTQRTIVLTTMKEANWAGMVTQVSLRPADAAGDAMRGARLMMRNLRLVGSLPSPDY